MSDYVHNMIKVNFVIRDAGKERTNSASASSITCHINVSLAYFILYIVIIYI